MKKILLVIPVCLTLVAGIWAFAAGDLQDPLVSLSQLTNVFTAMVESKVEEKLDQSDAQLREAAAKIGFEIAIDRGDHKNTTGPV